MVNNEDYRILNKNLHSNCALYTILLEALHLTLKPSSLFNLTSPCFALHVHTRCLLLPFESCFLSDFFFAIRVPPGGPDGIPLSAWLHAGRSLVLLSTARTDLHVELQRNMSQTGGAYGCARLTGERRGAGKLH